MEFHFHTNDIQAGATGSALAVSAYISGGTSAYGKRINNPHKPEDIRCRGLTLPPGAHFRNARDMWDRADQAERRKDGEYSKRGGHMPIIASHANLSIPWSSNEDQARQIANRFCRYMTETHGVGIEWSVHVKKNKKTGEERLDHIHFMWTSRVVNDAGFGGKARTLNKVAMTQDKDREPVNPMTAMRWEAAQAILEATNVWWDPRSFKERGIDLVPEPKLNRRRLCEERRKAEKLGLEGPTQSEQEIAEFRALRAELVALREAQQAGVDVVAPEPAEAAPVAPEPAPAAGPSPVSGPSTTVMPPQGGAARPPVAPPAQEEPPQQKPPRPRPEPFNPFTDSNGMIRDQETQRLGATIIRGARRQDKTLMDATLGLLAAMLKGSWDAAHAAFQGVLLWADTPQGQKTRAKYADVQPFTLAELEARTTQAGARAAARRRREEQAANQGGPEPQPKPRPQPQKGQER